MIVKIATWNMAYWSHQRVHDEAWAFLLDEIAPDIALVQEARPPTSLDGAAVVWHPVLRRSRKEEAWGSGVVTRGLPLTELDFDNSQPGSLVGAEVALPNDLSLTVFSMYGVLETGRGGPGYATASVHRMLSDLTFVLMGEGEYQGKNANVVLGGDLNISVQCDEMWGRSARYTNAHRICLERIEDFGLCNCYPPYGGDYVQTLRHLRSSVPWQNDYLFLSRKLAGSLKSWSVLDEGYDERIRQFSDHNPVVIELSL